MDTTIAAYNHLYRHGLDTELADRRQLRDGGSNLEPLERGSLLETFQEGCRVWYGWREDPCVNARRSVYTALLDRYGPKAVVRWQHRIQAVLDTAEAEVYATIRDSCPLCRRHHALGDETVSAAYDVKGRQAHSVVMGMHSTLRPCLSGRGETEGENGD